MLKRTMICACVIFVAQSLALSAAQAQEDDSVSLDSTTPTEQPENLIAQVDQKPASESIDFESTDSESIDPESIDSEDVEPVSAPPQNK